MENSRNAPEQCLREVSNLLADDLGLSANGRPDLQPYRLLHRRIPRAASDFAGLPAARSHGPRSPSTSKDFFPLTKLKNYLFCTTT
jgi:hypothetical protein